MKSASEPMMVQKRCYGALGMRDYLAVKVRYRLGSRNC